MNIKKLDDTISEDIEAFEMFVDSRYSEGSDSPVTSGDLFEFGKQASYALSSLRENIIEYLKSK